MGRREEEGREEDGLQVEGETREERGAEGEEIGIATRKRQQVRRADAYRNFRLKIALTQKFLCYFWKWRKTKTSRRRCPAAAVRQSAVLLPSFVLCGCLLETDTPTAAAAVRAFLRS